MLSFRTTLSGLSSMFMGSRPFHSLTSQLPIVAPTPDGVFLGLVVTVQSRLRSLREEDRWPVRKPYTDRILPRTRSRDTLQSKNHLRATSFDWPTSSTPVLQGVIEPYCGCQRNLCPGRCPLVHRSCPISHAIPLFFHPLSIPKRSSVKICQCCQNFFDGCLK